MFWILIHDRFKESVKKHFLEYISIVSATKTFLKEDSYSKEKSKETTTILQIIQQTITQPKLNKLVYNKILTN